MDKIRTKAKIFIIEGDTCTLTDLKAQLINWGYTLCDVAFSSEKKFELIEQFQPDILIMDIISEEETEWINTADIIKSRWDIPIVLLTDKVDPGWLEPTESTRPFGYLLKSFHDMDLMLTLEMALYVARIGRERRIEEEKRRESEESLRLFINNLPGVAFIENRQGEKVFANNKYYEIVRPLQSDSESVKKQGVIPPEMKERIRVDDEAMQPKPGAVEFEHTYKTETGNTYWLTHRFLIQGARRDFLTGYFSMEITDQKRAEEALLTEHLRLKQAYKLAGIGYWDWDKDTDVLKWTEELYTIFGQSRFAFKPSIESFEACIHPDDLERFREETRKLDGNNELRIEYRIVLPDGSIRLVEGLANVIRDDNGKTRRVIGTVRDITEEKNSEIVLKESENNYRNIVEYSPDGIFVADRNGNYIEVNNAACKLTGYSRDELLSMHLTDIVTTNEREKAGDSFHSLHIKEHISRDIELKRKDGANSYIALDAVKLSENSYLGFCKDITDRKRVENALEKRLLALTQPLDDKKNIPFEDLFNLDDIQRLQDQLSSATGVASIITYPDGTPITKSSNKTGFCKDIFRKTDKGLDKCYRSNTSLLEKCNPQGPIIQHCQGCGLWKAGSSIMVGRKHVATWIIGPVRDQTQTEEKMREYARLVDADEDTVLDAFDKLPCMSLFQFSNIAQTFQTVANQLSTVAYQNIQQARFITEHKRAEKEKEDLQSLLHQAQKMETVGTLTGGIIHDFNNLLQSIIGHAQLILLENGEDFSSVDDLNSIVSASKRAKELIQQLLLFSRKAEVDRHSTDLNNEVERAKQILERTIPKMITIETHLSSPLWTVDMAPVQVEQVLLNLGTNAADAMPEGGKLVIQTENLTLDKEYAKNHLGSNAVHCVLLTVSDTGVGMDRETATKIFEPFFTTKEIGKGTGLGLASVYGIIKGNGGNITCSSEAGHGTTFKIHLPATAKTISEVAEAHPVEVTTGGSESILVVDDEQSIRYVVSQAFRMFGYTVLTASSGEEALEIFKKNPGQIDLIILDIGMPGMGGYNCLQELIQIDPAVKVLIVSGYSFDSQVSKALAVGAAGYVNKPFQFSDLLNKSRLVLDMDNVK